MAADGDIKGAHYRKKQFHLDELISRVVHASNSTIKTAEYRGANTQSRSRQHRDSTSNSVNSELREENKSGFRSTLRNTNY